VDPRFEFYAITDQSSALGRGDLEVAQGLIEGGATCLQYRAKKVSAKEQWPTAFALRALCKAAGLPFIVNDRIDLALDCEADGVHLGQDDVPMAAARRLAGKKMLIGRSTHSLAEAREASESGADYIGFGPLYLTGTKENNVPPLGLKTVAQALRGVKVPLVAIGGIKLQHLDELAQEGLEHVAVVTALTGAASVAQATREFVARWRGARLKGHPHP
jgi:thiamine-phosphate pyrophosphorylase